MGAVQLELGGQREPGDYLSAGIQPSWRAVWLRAAAIQLAVAALTSVVLFTPVLFYGPDSPLPFLVVFVLWLPASLLFGLVLSLAEGTIDSGETSLVVAGAVVLTIQFGFLVFLARKPWRSLRLTSSHH